MLVRSLAVSAVFSLLVTGLNAKAEEGYYTSPASVGNSLIFTSEGDLWRLDAGQEQAFRLTTHDEVEAQSTISPDGKLIAFAASFDGIGQVYVMALDGGSPKQVTFEMAGVTVRGWSPDGRILYTSRSMEGTSRVRELRLVDPETLEVERIPLRYATTGTFNEDGDTLYFTRHGVATVGDNARLYRGGGMSQLWKYDMGSDSAAQRLAESFEGPINTPMHWLGRIYFMSDQSGYDNIWSMTPDGGDIRQHTDQSGWQLQDANLRDGVIHYQKGADIYAYTIANGQTQKIDIDLATDNDRSRLRWIDKPLNYFTSAHLSGKGDTVAITARGEVTIASNDARRRVELNIPGEARARSATFSPDGKWVYLIQDADERGEIWKYNADGSGVGEQLTSDATAHRWRIYASPDGKWLIHDDKFARLWKFNLETQENTLIHQTFMGGDDDFAGLSFSEDGRFIAFQTTGKRASGSVIMVHDLNEGSNHIVTGEKYISGSPTFSKDGKWLYFLSDRNFNPTPGAPWGDRNMGSQFDRRSQIFALAIDEEAEFPFTQPNELTLAKKEEEKEEAEKKKETEEESADEENSEDVKEEGEAEEEPLPEINWQGVKTRLYQVPVSAGNYRNLKAGKGRLYLIDGRGRSSALKNIALGHEDIKLETYARGVSGYELSSDASKVFYTVGGRTPRFIIAPAGKAAPKSTSKLAVRTNGWRLAINPEAEWSQIFLDGWRMHRDFAFDRSMRGVNWNGVRDKLLPLASRVGHRSELADLQGQMSSEIGILHSQVRGGDTPADAEKGVIASLGARFKATEQGLEIVQIYQGEAELPQTMGPLSKAGLDIQVGDVISSVNNRPINSRADLDRELMHEVGAQTLLEITRGEETHKEVVKPVSLGAEFRLRYLDWVGSNATKVAEASDGEIGYLHLNAMGGGDVASFARDFFPQNHLDGLIVDVRDNNGGNIDSFIIQQFLRRVWAFWQFEPDSPGYGNMQETFRGHFVVLINAGTYSDGETFAAGVKALDLAPLIGTRTAGAGIWLSGRNSQTDGGMARIAESPQFGLDGRWLIEGYGINPDILVDNEPNALFKGEDQQLNAAVAYLKEKIISDPIPELKPLPLPPMGERGKDVEKSQQ